MAERAEEISGILNKSVITIEPNGRRRAPFRFVTQPTSLTRSRGPAVSASRRRIRLEEPIRPGYHQVSIRSGEVEASVKVIVVPKL